MSKDNSQSVSDTSKEPDVSVPADESTAPTPDENAKTVWKDSYAVDGLSSADDIYHADYYFDGTLTDNYTVAPETGDAKLVLRGLEKSRFVNIADGYMMTLPAADVTADFSLAEYRCSLTFGDHVLSVSKEDKSPYGNTPEGWEIYFREWLTMRIGDTNFISENNLMRTSAVKTYTDIIEGYEVTEYDLYIKLPKDVEHPHYSIAIIRPVDDYVNFYLAVMKSAEKSITEFKAILSSMSFFESEGESANHVGQYELSIPDFWSDETKAYYNKLMNNTVPDWGFFYAGNSNDYIDWLTGSEGINYTPEVFMTYLHIGWYDTKSYLDLDYVNRNAGGDGFNGKPVLNLTYQFTTTNNNISGYTPMFDILRGKYDDHFRKLAQDIKSYGKPVIFRLNNEMNTDWTSYCGIVTLLDPDIYTLTWQRMYDIFVEEGVNNTIWVFNPITVTCPYCDWGEALTYFPGPEYCQMLGLTYYEPANSAELQSFKKLYTKTYEMFEPYFDNYPWMIGEFACGAGGEKEYDWSSGSYKTYTLGHSEDAQAKWVREMFEDFADNGSAGYEFAEKIKVAIWFSANDYVDIEGTSYIINYYNLDERLDKTLAVMREWLPKLHAGE